MSLKILIFVAVISLVAGLSDDQKKLNGEVTSKPVRYCQPQTPCGWKIYNYIDTPELFITNVYCECPPSRKCKLHEPNAVKAHAVYRCKP